MSSAFLLLPGNNTINRSRMQTSSDLNIRRRSMPSSITQQVDNSTREVILSAQALQRRRQPHLVALTLALDGAHRTRHLRVHVARRDGVDADVVGRQLDGQRPGEHEDSALGGVVSGHAVAGEGDVGRLRGDEDHAAAGALLDDLLGH